MPTAPVINLDAPTDQQPSQDVSSALLDISSVHSDERAARQAHLDALASEYNSAVPQGVYSEWGNQELFSDGTWRDVQPAGQVFGPPPSAFNIPVSAREQESSLNITGNIVDITGHIDNTGYASTIHDAGQPDPQLAADRTRSILREPRQPFRHGRELRGEVRSCSHPESDQ